MNHPRVSDVIALSFARTRAICFEGFDAMKWLGLAAASWLAWLGVGQRAVSIDIDDLGTSLGDLGLDELTPLVWAVAGASLAVATVAWVALTWLRSRGQLMFIDLVARDASDLASSWTASGVRAGELFRLRLVLDVIGMLLFLPFGAGVAVSLWVLDGLQSADPTAWLPALLGMGVSAALFLAWAFVTFWLNELVVPVAYSWQVPMLDAAAEVRRLVATEPATFAVYLVVRVASAFFVAWLAFSLSCLLCLVAWIPFVSALFLLPFRVFLQGMPLAFLYQVDHSAYAVFAPLQADTVD